MGYSTRRTRNIEKHSNLHSLGSWISTLSPGFSALGPASFKLHRSDYPTFIAQDFGLPCRYSPRYLITCFYCSGPHLKAVYELVLEAEWFEIRP